MNLHTAFMEGRKRARRAPAMATPSQSRRGHRYPPLSSILPATSVHDTHPKLPAPAVAGSLQDPRHGQKSSLSAPQCAPDADLSCPPNTVTVDSCSSGATAAVAASVTLEEDEAEARQPPRMGTRTGRTSAVDRTQEIPTLETASVSSHLVSSSSVQVPVSSCRASRLAIVDVIGLPGTHAAAQVEDLPRSTTSLTMPSMTTTTATLVASPDKRNVVQQRIRRTTSELEHGCSPALRPNEEYTHQRPEIGRLDSHAIACSSANPVPLQQPMIAYVHGPFGHLPPHMYTVPVVANLPSSYDDHFNAAESSPARLADHDTGTESFGYPVNYYHEYPVYHQLLYPTIRPFSIAPSPRPYPPLLTAEVPLAPAMHQRPLFPTASVLPHQFYQYAYTLSYPMFMMPPFAPSCDVAASAEHGSIDPPDDHHSEPANPIGPALPGSWPPFPAEDPYQSANFRVPAPRRQLPHPSHGEPECASDESAQYADVLHSQLPPGHSTGTTGATTGVRASPTHAHPAHQREPDGCVGRTPSGSARAASLVSPREPLCDHDPRRTAQLRIAKAPKHEATNTSLASPLIRGKAPGEWGREIVDAC